VQAAGKVAVVATGRLITIEGLDGAGKTTLAEGLVGALRARGIDVELLREPGGVPASERLRDLVKDPALHVAPRAEALIYAAARAQLVAERVAPLLERGGWVLLDRFADSMVAYQGVARDLGMEEVDALNRFAIGDVKPDRTLLLRIEPLAGRERLADRGDAPDRLEGEAASFFAAVADGYDRIAAAEPERVRTIDASATPDEVLARALAELDDLL
jgi:dTMP kinase